MVKIYIYFKAKLHKFIRHCIILNRFIIIFCCKSTLKKKEKKDLNAIDLGSRIEAFPIHLPD